MSRLLLIALLALLTACGAAQRCPAGTAWDECAHGSCPECDDCVGECVPTH